MAYRLKRREGFATGIARIVDEQLASAAKGLRGKGDPDLEEAVHDARKRLKKSRSALRLARYDIADPVRRKENEIMRDAGRRLSGLRDAQVLVDTLGGFKDELGRRPYKALRSRLEAARDDLAERPDRLVDARGRVVRLGGARA
jgi:CHAD domain-containing protein